MTVDGRVCVDYTTERHLTILCHQLFDAISSTSLASLAGKNMILDFMKFLILRFQMVTFSRLCYSVHYIEQILSICGDIRE
jgi:hypothetical protein